MPRILAALVTTLLTTLLACLGVVVDPSIAATPDLSAVVTHVYDAAVYDEPTNYAALERGPPAAQVQLADSVSHLAVDLGLQGTLTHPGVTTTHADTHYDQPGQRDKRTGTTGSRAGAADGKLSALLRALVAANSARSAVQGYAAHLRIHTLVGDARIELQKSTQKYDVIFIDAYSGINAIPWQLTTVEFYHIVEEHLAPGGVVISNTIVNIAPGSTKVLDSYVKTQKEVFGHISVYNAVDKVASQTTANAMIIAANSEKVANSVAMKYITQDRFVKSNIDLGYLNGGIVLRDNYAPIEYFGLEELIH